MEKHEKRHKYGKQKAQIGFSGGNIGGLVLWGGALAVVSVIAAFSAGKSRRNDASNKNDSSQKGDDEGVRVDVVPGNPSSTSHQDQCCASYGSTNIVEEAKIDSYDGVSTKSLILVNLISNDSLRNSVQELGSRHVINSQNENSNVDYERILITDDSKEENDQTCKDYVQVEECSSAATENEASNPFEGSVHVITGKETCDMVSFTVEDNSSKKSVEIEEHINGVDAGDIDSRNPELHGIKPLDYTCSYSNSWDHSIQEQSLDPAVNKGNQNSTGDPEGIAISYDSEENLESCVGDEQFSTLGMALCGAESGITDFSEEEKEIYDNESFTEEENSPKESVEENISDGVGCEDSSGDNMIENGSEEGTRSSSAESRIEAIWPAEEIEALALELENKVVNHQKPVEEEGDEEHIQFKKENSKLAYDYELTGNSTILRKRSTMQLVTMNDRMRHSRNRRVWVWLTLVVLALLLLLIFIDGGALSYYRLNRESTLLNEL